MRGVGAGEGRHPPIWWLPHPPSPCPPLRIRVHLAQGVGPGEAVASLVAHGDQSPQAACSVGQGSGHVHGASAGRWGGVPGVSLLGFNHQKPLELTLGVPLEWRNGGALRGRAGKGRSGLVVSVWAPI